ncbi:PREDICTED: uncharacterized protein LOC109231046 isoform X2 [Nicotiana attenuata]|uniref:uncharacterized protein LOC109231046 isoform X2 n=1 Tax=Nicotiana attenuata TaxID=49451 RepID=UPI0009059CFE|nr:PREDICTED: uncharacterized protein LOC109231046 isoform X2 [Nicotiana attenuata]
MLRRLAVGIEIVCSFFDLLSSLCIILPYLNDKLCFVNSRKELGIVRLRLEEVQRILLDICSKIATYILVAWQALSSVVSSVPKEVLPTYIKLVRDAASTSRDKERRKKKGGPVLIPGFCLPKALQPLLPIFLQALDSYYR